MTGLVGIMGQLEVVGLVGALDKVILLWHVVTTQWGAFLLQGEGGYV